MVSVVYISILALLIVWLSLNVIKKRRSNHVSIGDGNNEELEISIAAHSNAIEYIPIALLLLFALELNGSNMLVVHLFGLLFVVSRVVHANGMLSSNLKVRVLGMKITIFTIMGLVIANFIYLPYAKLFKF